MKQEMSGWQWHQLDHRQLICTLWQTDNHASISPLNLLQVECSSWCPTNSVKALNKYLNIYAKHERHRWITVHITRTYTNSQTAECYCSVCQTDLFGKKQSQFDLFTQESTVFQQKTSTTFCLLTSPGDNPAVFVLSKWVQAKTILHHHYHLCLNGLFQVNLA